MKIICQLFHRTCPHNNRSHSFVFQDPCQCHLSQSLATTSGYFIQPTCFSYFIFCHLIYFQKSGRTGRTRMFRNTMQIFFSQQALRQRRKCNKTGALFCPPGKSAGCRTRSYNTPLFSIADFPQICKLCLRFFTQQNRI